MHLSRQKDARPLIWQKQGLYKCSPIIYTPDQRSGGGTGWKLVACFICVCNYGPGAAPTLIPHSMPERKDFNLKPIRCTPREQRSGATFLHHLTARAVVAKVHPSPCAENTSAFCASLIGTLMEIEAKLFVCV
jgi:hypothetical protein